MFCLTVAFNQLQHIYFIYIARTVFEAWHNVTLNSKKTREYFEVSMFISISWASVSSYFPVIISLWHWSFSCTYKSITQFSLWLNLKSSACEFRLFFIIMNISNRCKVTKKCEFMAWKRSEVSHIVTLHLFKTFIIKKLSKSTNWYESTKGKCSGLYDWS